MKINDFHNLHNGQTCLIVGVGPNLKLTPPTWFNYPSFGVNSIYKQTDWDWKPTYYVGVDERLRLEDGEAVVKAYPDIPKFFPRPDWDDLQGENIYRFLHRQGSSLYIGGQSSRLPEALTKNGITYRRIMDAVFQIAWWMGFTTMLMIGVSHKTGDRKNHFYGVDPNDPSDCFTFEELGYQECIRMMNGVTVLNISEDTHVPETTLPRDNWRNWKNA